MRDMGLYDCGSSLSLSGFLIGIIVANFQTGGTSPLSHESLIYFNSSILFREVVVLAFRMQ